MKLLSIGSNPKMIKSDKASEYLTASLSLFPTLETCPMSEIAGCFDACLKYAGRGQMNSVETARQRKTNEYLADPIAFVDQVKLDMGKAVKRATKLGKKLACRLNVLSDIPWENIKGSNGKTILEEFPNVQFYDYTKLPGRKVPSNYHLTVSYSGANPAYAKKVSKTPHNIAVVFREKNLPAEFLGREVINGDKTDLRFIDKTGVVVGLYAKGPAKNDYSGFVIDNNLIAIGA